MYECMLVIQSNDVVAYVHTYVCTYVVSVEETRILGCVIFGCHIGLAQLNDVSERLAVCNRTSTKTDGQR